MTSEKKTGSASFCFPILCLHSSLFTSACSSFVFVLLSCWFFLQLVLPSACYSFSLFFFRAGSVTLFPNTFTREVGPYDLTVTFFFGSNRLQVLNFENGYFILMKENRNKSLSYSTHNTLLRLEAQRPVPLRFRLFGTDTLAGGQIWIL